MYKLQSLIMTFCGLSFLRHNKMRAVQNHPFRLWCYCRLSADYAFYESCVASRLPCH